MNRILNWIVIALLAIGSVFLLEKLLSTSSNDLVILGTQLFRYASIPCAVFLKAAQLVNNELKKISDIRDLALSNRGNDDTLKAQIAYLIEDFKAKDAEMSESIRGIDRRMIRLEAKSELSTKLERHERLIQEIAERINNS